MSVDFGSGLENVKITILSNNNLDATLQTDPQFQEKVIQPFGTTAAALAEQGLVMKIEVNTTNILYDFGGLGFAILKNLEILKINPKTLQKVVLSHGHADHFGSFMKVLPLLGAGKEIIVSPNVYRQKLGIGYRAKPGEIFDLDTLNKNYRVLKKENKIQERPPLNKAFFTKLIMDNSQTLIETRDPVELAPSIWTSGEIQLFDENEVTPNFFLKINKSTFEKETFRDEIAIYIKVKNKGLIVLTGCGHTGIINIIKHGQAISRTNKIYAVIGGFHLTWSSKNQLESIIDYFKEIKPEIICGMHCTGFEFTAKLFSEMPESATLGVVGTIFNL